MRILALSDIHLDYIRLRHGLRKEEIKEFSSKVRDKISSFNPDIFILAGDISRKIEDIEIFFEVLKDTNFQKIYVPGNHDLWIENGLDSSQKYRNTLEEISKMTNFHYLPFNPLVINYIGFVGNVGWYDYSLGSDEFSIEKYDRGEYRNLKWREVYWKLIIFKDNSEKVLSNKEICKLMQEELQKQIESIKDKVEVIVTVTHTLPFEDLIYTKNFFSAYLGSKYLGDIILKTKKIKYLICGHEHSPLILNKNGINIYRCPFGYLKNLKDWEEYIIKGIKSFEIII